MATLRLSTLGDAALSRSSDSDTFVQLLGAGKPLAILTYLACSPRRVVNREHLLDLLWADLQPKRARHALRQALWYLRHHVDEHLVSARDADLILDAELCFDRDDFLAAMERGDNELAVELYAGNFLEGFATPGGADFEQWVEIERNRLKKAFQLTGTSLVRSWLSSGRGQEAIRLARRMRDLDNFSQALWRLLLETLVSADGFAAGAAEATALEKMLAAQGRQPDPATSRLLALVDTSDEYANTTESPVVPRPPLWAELTGREPQFSAIMDSWELAKRGVGSHVTIVAPAGLGKTRLLNDVRARLRAAGACLVRLRANPGERNIPYAFAGSLAKTLCGLPGAVGISPPCASTLVTLNPTLCSQFAVAPERGSEDDALRRRTFALADLLEAGANEQPVVVLIEDLHWIDDASLNVLAGLAGRVKEVSILLVTTTRPLSHCAILETTTVRLELLPLSPDHIGAFVNSIGCLPNEIWACQLPTQLYKATTGSPLLLLETVQLAMDSGVLALKAGAWSCEDPVELAEFLLEGAALTRRIQSLDRSDSWLLLLLACAGVPLHVEKLARMAGRSTVTARDQLHELEQRGFVRSVDAEYEIAHDDIAALSVECASPDAVNAAMRTIGDAFVEFEPHDVISLTRAAQFHARAGDHYRLKNTFRLLVGVSRRHGDVRSARRLAENVLGPCSSGGIIHETVRALPMHMRLGLHSAKRVAAVLAILALVTIAGLVALL